MTPPVAFPAFYPILDSALLTTRAIHIEAAADALLLAGVGILQYRHKGNFTDNTLEYLRQLQRQCELQGVVFVINDRADIAALVGCGVHVGQHDLTPTDARRVAGSKACVGFSTHNHQQLAAGDSEPVDYLAIGPIYGTASKQNPDPVVGTDALASLRALTQKPLVAIGGITLENAPRVFAQGVDSVALISGFLPASGDPRDMEKLAREWVSLTAEYRKA